MIRCTSFDNLLFPKNKQWNRALFNTDTHEGRSADEKLGQRVGKLLELDGAFSGVGLCHGCLLDWPDGSDKATVSLSGVLDNSVSPPVVCVRLSCLSYCQSCREKAAAQRMLLVDYFEARAGGTATGSPLTCVSYSRSYGAACHAASAPAAVTAVRPRPLKAPAAVTAVTVSRATTRAGNHDPPVLLSSSTAAKDWASQHRDRLSDSEVDQLRTLDFSMPPTALRALALALMAVSEWVLSAAQAEQGTGAAQHASIHTSASPADLEGSLTAQLRDWAVAVREDDTVLLYGGVARPSLRSCSVHGMTLSELLSMPPLRPSLASADQLALRLQRLGALLKQRSGRDAIQPWKVPSRELPARLLGLVAALQYSDGSMNRPAGRGAVSGGGTVQEASGSGAHRVPAKGALSAEEILGEVGVTLTQVQQALAKPQAGVMCAHCGRKGRVRACTTCADAFCAECMGCRTMCEPLPKLWCRYCMASLALTSSSDEASKPALALWRLGTDLSRILAHCRQSGDMVDAALNLPIELRVYRTASMCNDEWRAMVARQPHNFWFCVVAVNGLALRALEAVYRSSEGPSPPGDGGGGAAQLIPRRQDSPASFLADLTQMLRTLFGLLASSGWQDDLRRKVLQAVIRAGTLQCSARLLASWHDFSRPQLHPKAAVLEAIMDLSCGCLSGVRLHSEIQNAACEGCTEAGEEHPLGEWRVAMVDSQLLEHAARVLLRLQEASTAAVAAGTVAARADAKALQPFLGSTDVCIVNICVTVVQRVERCHLELLGPRPLRAPRDAVEMREAAFVKQSRSALSGPCLQYLMVRDLLATRRRLTGGEGAPSYGLTEEQLTAGAWADANASVPPLQALLWAIGMINPILTIAVSGPRRPLIVQPPAGWLPGGAETHVDMSPGVPFLAVNVYDMYTDVLGAALSALPAPEGTEIEDLHELYLSLCLLARLVMELPAPQAEQRLPGLWRLWSTMAFVMDAMPRLGTMFHFGLLLRLDLQPPQSPRDQEEGEEALVPPREVREVAGGQAAADGGEAAAGAMEEPAGLGPRLSSPAGCFPSIRVALEAGFLPAVERLLRVHAGRLEDVDGWFATVNHLLRFSGAWAPALAHGSAREAASLIVTLRKAAGPLLDGLLRNWSNASSMGVEREGPAGCNASLSLRLVHMAFLEQMAALLLLPGVEMEGGQQAAPPGQSGGGASSAGPAAAAALCGAYSEKARQGDVGTEGSGTEPGPGPPCPSKGPTGAAAASARNLPQRLLALNDLMDRKTAHGLVRSDSAPMQLEWLVRAGGRPGPDSPAGQQQRVLAVFALTEWLPRAMAGYSSHIYNEEITVVLRWLLAAALQCLAARQTAGLLPAEATLPPGATGQPSASDGGPMDDTASVATGDGTSGLSNAGGISTDAVAEASRSYLSWESFLQDELKVWHWFNNWFRGLDFSRLSESEQAWQPMALDALEVLSVALPGGLGFYCKKLSVNGRAGGEGPSSSAAASGSSAPAAGTWGIGSISQMFRQHGRTALLAELERVSLEFAKKRHHREPNPACGNSSGAPWDGPGPAGASSPDPNWPPPLAALLSEVLAKHDLANLPPLPSPAAALEAVAAAGVRPCCNPACDNLEGPSEAALVAAGGKTCSRCKAVWYCCGACQLTHWRAGHQAQCSGGEARALHQQRGGSGEARSTGTASGPQPQVQVECRMS